jgi:hypothetical protein
LKRFLPVLFLAATCATAFAPPPGWWAGRGVTNADPKNDWAAINQGQAKQIAAKAADELDAKLPGGAGIPVHDLIASWRQPAQGRDDFLAVNNGMLKALAKPFWARLIAQNYASASPWAGTAADHAMANIGQTKSIFAFDLTAFRNADAGGNGLGDRWEIHYFGAVGQNPSGDPDGDGLTNLQEFQHNTDPKNPDSDFDGVNDSQEVADATNPNSYHSYTPRRIAYFPFSAFNFQSAEGQAPRAPASGQTLPQQVVGFPGNGMRITTNSQQIIYDWKRPDGGVNYSFRRGTVRMWVKPEWSTATMSGTWSRLFELGGGYSNGKAYAIFGPHATEPKFGFSEADGASHFTPPFETTTPFTWAANTWHQVVLTYSPTKRTVYIDGAKIGETTLNWSNVPKVDDIIAGGIQFGNDWWAAQPIKGTIDEVECFNYEFNGSTVALQYQAEAEYRIDGDGNGLPDAWEREHFDDIEQDPSDDPDEDGLTNLEEFDLGTDPKSQDSDGDGMPDKWEIDHGFNPKDPSDAFKDDDDDGLTNAEEYEAGSLPDNPNTDGDKLPNGQELLDGMDAEPTDPAIRWYRAPESRYAVLHISDDYEPITIGNNNTVLLGKQDGNGHLLLKLWTPGGETTQLQNEIAIDDHVEVETSTAGNWSYTADKATITAWSRATIADDGSITIQGRAGGTLYFAARWASASAAPVSYGGVPTYTVHQERRHR